VIPSYTNPQDLNRYSYVNNNPLRYTDPSGHMRIVEEGSKRGCSDPKYCRGGKPKPQEELKKMREHSSKKKSDNSPFATVTPQPTSTSMLPYIQMTQPSVLVEGPSQTPTPLPTSTPQPIGTTVAQWASDQINNVDPIAPGIEQAIPADCVHPVCGAVLFVNTVYNETLYTLVILNDIFSGSSSTPGNIPSTLSPTPSPTLTTIPASSTPVPQFQTPMISPTAPSPAIRRPTP
jgi:hypothetical protein